MIKSNFTFDSRGVGWRDAPGEMVAEGWKTVNHTSLRCAKGYDPETTPSPVFAELGH